MPPVWAELEDVDPRFSLPWQHRAWRFYGAPDGSQINAGRLNQGAVGEVRYVLGWIAEQIGRVSWHVDIDGERLDDDEAKELTSQVTNSQTATLIAANLLVAGELHYAAYQRDQLTAAAQMDATRMSSGYTMPGTDEAAWMPISVVAPERKETIEAAELWVRGIWPHPGDVCSPDPPLRGVLDVLEELEQLADIAHAQGQSRIANTGILEVAQEYSFIKADDGSSFHDDLQRAAWARIRDPRSSAANWPMVRGPAEHIGSGIHWSAPPARADELETRMRFLITRLSWGFPVPPELLTGMTATNRATAFQIEDSTYRSHIEPVAKLVGRVLAAALALLLDRDDDDDRDVVEMTPDASDLLARRHSVADAFSAYDRGLVRGEWVRSVIGVDEEDAATEEDLLRIERLKGVADAEADPASSAEREGVQSALTLMQAPETVTAAVAAAAGDAVDLDTLAQTLADIDSELRAMLSGAITVAMQEAVRRVGARARTLNDRAPGDSEVDLSDVDNLKVPSTLGEDQLAALEVNAADVIHDALRPTIDWWRSDELPAADKQVNALLATVGIEAAATPEQLIEESATMLWDGLTAYLAERVAAWPLPAAPGDLIRDVIAVAGGDD